MARWYGAAQLFADVPVRVFDVRRNGRGSAHPEQVVDFATIEHLTKLDVVISF